jgi:hypothetical protein
MKSNTSASEPTETGPVTALRARLGPNQNRTHNLAATVAAIAAIAGVTCFCVHHGIDHTLVKLGIAAIAGLGGFTLRGLFVKS